MWLLVHNYSTPEPVVTMRFVRSSPRPGIIRFGDTEGSLQEARRLPLARHQSHGAGNKPDHSATLDTVLIFCNPAWLPKQVVYLAPFLLWKCGNFKKKKKSLFLFFSFSD